MAEQQLVLIDRGSRWTRSTLLAAMVLTGLSMRTAAVTVGPVLEEVESGLHVTPAARQGLGQQLLSDRPRLIDHGHLASVPIPRWQRLPH